MTNNATIEPSIKKQSSLYFPALTGVRALAAYAVFWYHCNPLKPGGMPWRFVNKGDIGVTIFFVLSGFLICLRYSNRVELSRKWVGRYVRNRVARIYPMYFLITFLTFLLIWIDPSYDPVHQWSGYTGAEKMLVLFLNASLLKAFFEQLLFTGIAPGWTLTVEECFYLAAPLLLLGLMKSKKRYALLVLYAIGLLLFGVAVVHLAPHNYGFFESYKFMLKHTFFGRCIEFISGMAFALFLRKRTPITISSSKFTWAGTSWIIITMLLLTHAEIPGTMMGIFINNVMLPPGIIMLFYGLITEQTWLRRLLETRLFDLLGKSSYVFYLIHVGVIALLIDKYLTINYFIHFPLLVCLSIVLFQFVEAPLHKRIVRSIKNAGG